MVEIFSFGKKHGPLNVPDVFLYNCFAIHNPYSVKNLRHHTGRNQDVQEYVLKSNFAKNLLECAYQRAVDIHPISCTIAFRCSGGRHRSVAMACLLQERLDQHGIPCTVTHRDIRPT